MEREGEGNERSGLLIYFSDYSPHISSDLEVECSDLSVLKLSLPKGPRTFFHFVMVVFYILPLFPSLSSALWPKPVPAVLRAALLRARRLPLRVRGSARCCGRTGGGDLGRGQGKKKEKGEKKSVVLFVCGVQTFSRRRGCCFARNSPRFFARHSSAGTFRTPCPVRGIRGGCAGSDPHPGLCHSCTTAGTGCRTTPPLPPRFPAFPLPLLSLPLAKGIRHHHGPYCLGDSTGSPFPVSPGGLEVAHPPLCCCLSFLSLSSSCSHGQKTRQPRGEVPGSSQPHPRTLDPSLLLLEPRTGHTRLEHTPANRDWIPKCHPTVTRVPLPPRDEETGERRRPPTAVPAPGDAVGTLMGTRYLHRIAEGLRKRLSLPPLLRLSAFFYPLAFSFPLSAPSPVDRRPHTSLCPSPRMEPAAGV